MRKLVSLLLALGCLSCVEDSQQPRPKSFLAHNYPTAEYERVEFPCPFSFEKNKIAKVVEAESHNPCWKNLEYPLMEGEIFLTYQPVKDNLDSLLRDAQKLPLQHTIKADVIEGDIYTNPSARTFGMFYEVEGDAASQAQFYLTDSTEHFLTGSVYFRAKPNFDSLLPAATYLRQDIRHLMETVRWE